MTAPPVGSQAGPSVSPTSGRSASSSTACGSEAAVALVGQEVRRLRERVVAEVHDQHLGRERLLGVPRRALRLAAAALGAGREVEHALPAEVLDRADAEGGVLVQVVDVVEGDRLALGGERLDRAERDRAPAEEHVERRHEDVQVLGVQHDDEEDQHHADVEQQPDALEHLERSRAARRSSVADRLRGEGALAVRQVLAPRAAAAPRNRNIVQMTLKIMNRISQAPPRCEPLNRDLRPSVCGLLRRRMTAKSPGRRRHMTAMKSWAKPSSVPVPDDRDGPLGVAGEEDAERLEVDRSRG